VVGEVDCHEHLWPTTPQQASLAGTVLDLRWQPVLEKCRHLAPAPPPFWQSAHLRAVSAVPAVASQLWYVSAVPELTSQH
jgi:hypothetical protein